MAEALFTRWVKGGQLATIGMVVIFCTWIAFRIFVGAVDPTLNQVFLLYAGGWVANLSYGATKREERESEKKIDQRVESVLSTDPDEEDPGGRHRVR